MGRKAKARRKARKRAAEAQRGYEAAVATPSRRPPYFGHESHDAALETAGRTILAWARYLDENHDLVTGLLSDAVKNIVGTGIVTIPTPRRPDGSIDEAFGATLIERRRLWERRADVTGELSWAESQRLMVRAWLRDGESFHQHVTGSRYPFVAGETPYRIELLEAEMVPHDFTYPDQGWRQGVRLNDWRQPTGYAVHKHHPGEHASMLFPAAALSEDDVKIVPAERMTHLKLCKRWPATRGVSLLHACIARLWDLKDLEDAERVKNRALANWTAAIKKSPEVAGFENQGPQGQRYIQMAHGTIIDTLAPGEELVGVGPDYPTANMPEHIADQVRRLAGGVEGRYSSIARRYDGSYSSMRQEQVDTEPHFRVREDAYVRKVCQPSHERLVVADLAAGNIRLPRGMSLERAMMAEHRGPITAWVDPLKEVQADVLAIENGLLDRRQVQLKRGMAIESLGAEPERPRQLELVSDADEDAA